MSVVRARTDAPHHVAGSTDSSNDGGGRGSPSALRLRRPSWRDRRLVVGAVLLLASTVLGARLLGAPDPGVAVWSARHDLPAGLGLRADDLELRRVHLDASAPRYVEASTSVPQGLVLARPVGSGELLPVSAVAPPSTPPDLRVVTVAVDRFHVADDLERGERVDVYVTPDAGQGSSTSRLLAADADVVDVMQDGGGFGGSGSSNGIAVAVPAAAVPLLVGGLGAGTVDIVRVSDGRR